MGNYFGCRKKMLFKKYEPQVLTQQTSAFVEINFILDKTLLFFFLVLSVGNFHLLFHYLFIC